MADSISMQQKHHSGLNYFVFWVITRRELFENDVSALPVCSIFKGQDVLGHLGL
jgi:hypothetical protein